jgi:hypothetical protein
VNKVWTALLAAAVAGPAFGQAAEVLYTPTRSIKDQDITVRSWGGGNVSETDEVAYEGTNSIRISTRNLFQGAILSFGKPENLGRTFENKNNLLRITYRLSDGGGARGTFPGGGPGGGGFGPPGGFPGGGPGGPGGGGRPGQGPPGGGPGGGGFGPPGGFPGGGPGGGFPGGPTTAASSSLETIRVVITTTDGKKSEAYLPVSTNQQSADRGWRNVAVPLQAISGFDRTNKVIRDITLSGDATTTFYLGDLRIVNDSTPISGQVRASRTNLALGDEVMFTATGNGGSSILRYVWDFDEEDGIQEDAEGQTVRRRFRKAGTYNVTLTVSDRFGLKQPYSTKVKLVVNP